MKDRHNSFGEAVGVVYRVASDSREWVSVLEGFQGWLNASAVCLGQYDFAEHQGRIVHAVGFESAYINDYSERYAVSNPWMLAGDCYAQGQVSVGDEIFSEENLVKTDFYRDWLKPQDFFYRICAIVKREDSQICYLEAFRSRMVGGFEASEKRFLMELLPHLHRAMTLDDYLWQMAIKDDVFNYQPYGVMAVNKTGKLLFANDLARELLEEADGLYLRGQSLHASNERIDGKLAGVIAGATSTWAATSREYGRLIQVPRSGNKLPLWVVVSSLGRRLRRVIGQEDDVVVVHTNAPEHVGELSDAMLKTFYGLTNAEQRLLRLILRGYRLNDASKELGVTSNTIRTHMKRIYAKTGAECQVDLVRLFLNSSQFAQNAA